MTLDNLQAAFNGESNAQAKYQAFAVKADEEGYSRVASLFRAAAVAEGIHAAAHARVIRQLGGTPKADIAKPHVHGTAENLKVAIEGETYERDVMYPEFIKEARKEEKAAAVRTFEYALAAEAEHAKLYQDALDNLAQQRSGKRDFYVCEVCGFTTPAAPERCPVCNARGEKLKLVN